MHLTLHLTARCNLRCRYCYAAPHAGGDMTLDTVKRAIRIAMDDLRRAHSPLNPTLSRHIGGEGVPSLGVIFFGGEPLMMRDLIADTVRHCRAVEAETGQLFHYKITTNGMLLDEAFLTDPDTSEVFVALSHDGVKPAHDAHRVDTAGAGTFDRLAPTATMLLKHKPYSPVMMVMTPETVAHYAESVEYLYETGFKYLICSLNYAADWDRASLSELKRQYQRLAEWYYRETEKEEKFYFSPFEVKIASHVYPGSCRAERCELGKRQISVAPNGCLYPCVQFVGDGSDTTYAIGHVDTGIDEDARARLYHLNDEEKSECASCAIRGRCNHYCGCLNKQATGRIDQVSPTLCAHERIVLPIADRLAERLYKRRNAMFIHKHYNDLFPLISLVEDSAERQLR